MSKGTLQSASNGLSVVDDVEDAPACSPQTGRGAHDDSEVIDLGGGYIEINGNVFYEDWEEIASPGCEDEEEIRMKRSWTICAISCGRTVSGAQSDEGEGTIKAVLGERDRDEARETAAREVHALHGGVLAVRPLEGRDRG